MKRLSTFILVVLCAPNLSLRAAEIIDTAKVRTFKEANSPNALAFSADGKRLFSASMQTISVWDVAEGTRIRTLKGHTKSVSALAVSKDGKRLISGSSGGVKIWDLDSTADMPLDIDTEDPQVISVALSPNEKYFATGGSEKMLRIWDFPSGKLRVAIEAHPRGVQCVDFSPDSKLLATCGYDTQTKLWDVELGKIIGTVGHMSHFDKCLFSRDGKFLAICGGGMRVVSHEGKELVNVWPDKVQTRGMSWSPDGKLLATGGMDKQLKLWDPATGKGLAVLDGHRGALVAVQFSPDGKYIASGAMNDPEVRLWPLAVPAAP